MERQEKEKAPVHESASNLKTKAKGKGFKIPAVATRSSKRCRKSKESKDGSRPSTSKSKKPKREKTPPNLLENWDVKITTRPDGQKDKLFRLQLLCEDPAQVELDLRLMLALHMCPPQRLKGKDREYALLFLVEYLEKSLGRNFSKKEVLQLVDGFYNIDMLCFGFLELINYCSTLSFSLPHQSEEDDDDDEDGGGSGAAADADAENGGGSGAAAGAAAENGGGSGAAAAAEDGGGSGDGVAADDDDYEIEEYCLPSSSVTRKES
ncbi:hypothetical protein RIF29_40450 [Crotalaria pallida]|uniref:Uncharacterized protein n=1 Tax=Crotalaria pallida TaxID=3830 RepID=A0AAN9E655_CROPI